MKTILMSIRPEWVAKILNGEKTIEIRKKFPKDYVGWVYIYCTKDNKQRLYPVALLDKSNQVFKRAYREDKIDNRTNYLNGKVVARFWCDKVEEIRPSTTTNFTKDSCLTIQELENYLWSNILFGYAIHITKLEIFDKPKEIGEFGKGKYNIYFVPVRKAPQSWCYVEL